MSSLRRSPAASVLDDDDLLSEILLRLPPQPSSLPHASLVCKRWRSLVSDPKFTRHFRLRHRHNPPLLGCSSKTGVWGDLIWMPIPSTTTMGNLLTMFLTPKPARLVENSLYWLLAGNCVGLLELDLERQNLTMIPLPVDVSVQGKPWDLIPMRAEGGGLGFFFLTDFTAQLWKRTTDGDGVTSWVLGRTIELGKLLSLNSEEERAHPWISGFADGSNVVFLRTLTGGFFMIHLELLQFKKLSGHNPISWYHPFESVYASVYKKQ